MSENNINNSDKVKALLSQKLKDKVFRGSDYFEKKKKEKKILITDLIEGEIIKSASGQYFLKKTIIPISDTDRYLLQKCLCQHQQLNSKTLSSINRSEDLNEINPKK